MKKRRTGPTPLPPDMEWRGMGATIRLPYLYGREAYLVAALLDMIQDAIWREHGGQMAVYHEAMFPDLPFPPFQGMKPPGRVALPKPARPLDVDPDIAF